MALLQVRNFPNETYTLLSLAAKKEKRSITQETIYLLDSMLTGTPSGQSLKRQSALAGLAALNLSLPDTAPSPVEFVRLDRNGTAPGSNRLR